MSSSMCSKFECWRVGQNRSWVKEEKARLCPLLIDIIVLKHVSSSYDRSLTELSISFVTLCAQELKSSERVYM